MTRIGPRICLKGPLCPNLTQKVQKEVSQIASRNLSWVMLLGGLSVNLNHLKTTIVIKIGWVWVNLKKSLINFKIIFILHKIISLQLLYCFTSSNKQNIQIHFWSSYELDINFKQSVHALFQLKKSDPPRFEETM